MSENTPFKGYESLSELGEFGLIDQIAKLFGSGKKSGYTGIGDDCAVLPQGDDRALLITTDMLIEYRHFSQDWISAEDLGYKSLAVNLSDISAMGGKPLYAFLSIGLPEDLSVEWIERFFRGTHELTKKHGVTLLGGDTTKSPGPMVINYTVIGEMQEDDILWRSSAEPGDHVAVLGNLGESGAGLKLLLEKEAPFSNSEQYLIEVHNRPQLFVNEAQFLARFDEVHAMIDLSDGIQSDAGHLAEKSGVTIQIEVDKLPVSEQLRQVCGRYSWPVEELALASGEDYGLLFSLKAEKSETISRNFTERFGSEFTIIGRVEKGPSDVRLTKNDKDFDLGKIGFDHFKSEK